MCITLLYHTMIYNAIYIETEKDYIKLLGILQTNFDFFMQQDLWRVPLMLRVSLMLPSVVPY